MFDRSWYNRGVVEHVFGFCTPEERQMFFRQLPDYEKMLVDDGISPDEDLAERGPGPSSCAAFSTAKGDPLKQWSSAGSTSRGLKKWDIYSDAIAENAVAGPHGPTPPLDG